MAASAERQMNLAALQQRDPYITGIVDTASQVALYSFSAKNNEWEKTDKEGTLFVYTRSAPPINGFMILNRLGLNDLIEPINKKLEFQLQDPFLLYRNAEAAIYGIWFYDKDECARIGQLMNSLVHVAAETQEKDSAAGRQRRASESDTLYERSATDFVDSAMNPKTNVDILQMLSKAQDEYDKSTGHVSPAAAAAAASHDSRSVSKTKAAGNGGRRAEPKPMIDNPSASATKTTISLIKPLALKASQSEEEGASAIEPTTPNTQITLDQLFKRATSFHQETRAQEPVVPRVRAEPVHKTDQMPPLLQRLMSNQGATLEEIERQQRGEIPRDQMPQPAGAEAPPGLPNGAIAVPVSKPPPTEPESPNTALKRTLNIIPTQSVQKPQEVSKTSDALPAHGPAAQRQPVQEPEEVHPGLMRQSSVDSSLISKPPVGSGSTSRTGPGEGLITPQALLQTAAASLPPSSGGNVVHAQHPVGASQLGMAANILLSPMAFQSGSPSSVQLLPQASGPNIALSDSCSTHSVSPHDFGVDNRLPQNQEYAHISPLTKEQFQQSFIHLLKNDPNFLASLHEGYVRCLNQNLSNRQEKL